MIRQVAFLMRASMGGLTHSEIMALTWRQFQVYLDSFTWLLREETKEGRKQNAKDDRRAMREDPRIKRKVDSEREEAAKVLGAFKERWNGKKGIQRRVV